jgi:Uma2 family endonuclease
MATAVYQPDASLLPALIPTTLPQEQGDGQNDGRAVSVEEYLRSSYDPDCDLVDGLLEERNMGEFDHGDLQAEISHIFRTNEPIWKVKAIVEVRLQTKPRNFRVPDVMVLHPGQKRAQIMREAPLACIEVFSPEDTWRRLKVKIDEYLALGVSHIWAFDPADRTAYRCDRTGYHLVTTPDLTIPNTPISLHLPTLFAVLDAN